MFSFAVWQPNILLFRYMTSIESILWIVHNWAYMSIAAVIVEIVVFCIKIVGVVKYYIDKKKEISKTLIDTAETNATSTNDTTDK